MKRRRGRYRYLAVLVLALSVGACRQTPQDAPLTEVTGEMAEAGGSVALEDGTAATLDAGFLTSAAEIRLSTSPTPLSTPPENVTDHYDPAAAVPIGLSTRVELPYAALETDTPFDERRELRLHVPSFPGDYDAEEAYFAEVHLELANGKDVFFFEPYRPTPLVTSDNNEGEDEDGAVDRTGDGVTDTLTINNLQLESVGKSVTDTVAVTVRPVRGASPLAAQAVATGFVLEDVVGGLNGGVAFDFAPDGRIFIAEKGGIVRVFENDALLSTPFINLSAQVNSRHDRGLLGVAVHPDFPAQPYVYLLFTHDPAGVSGTGAGGLDGEGARVSRLVRVTADAARNYNVALPNSEKVLLGTNSTYANIGNPNVRNGPPSCGTAGAYVRDCLPSDEQSHTIGTVRFGQDGSLFVSNGDGTNYTAVQTYATRALEVDSLAGKVLRIDPLTGEGYTDNPFYDGNPNANRSKVYSLGLRNPFRFAIHPVTGEPFIGDVGWNTWEEVNTGRGANFGWPCFEGGSGVSLQQGGYRALDRCKPLYTDPSAVTPALHAYTHGGQGSSVQVGDFYTGSAYPAAYQGALFLVDYNRKFINYLTFDGGGRVTDVRTFGSEAGVVQLSAGPDTNLYLMNILEGKLKRLRYTAAGNNAPTAQAGATPTAGVVPLTVAFSGISSFDPDGDALTYSWTFGDGSSASEADPTHVYTAAGVYRATLTVRDPAGATSRATVTVEASDNRPVATILFPADGVSYAIGDTITFSGAGDDAQDGTLSGDSLSWKLNLHHNDHTHFDELPSTNGESGSFVVSDHGDNTWLELCLTATDRGGQKDTSCVSLRPSTVQYTLQTEPSGLELSWEGVSRKAPFTVTTIINSSHQLVAPATQAGLEFKGWSDSGARVHPITVGGAPATLTATYAAPPPTTPPPTTPPPTTSCEGLTREAEEGKLFGSFKVDSEDRASGGKYIHAPNGTGNAMNSPDNAHRAEYCFTVATAGTYRLEAWVYAPNNADNSFFVTVDGAPAGGYLWDTLESTTYSADYVSQRGGADPAHVTLSAGKHTVTVYKREDGTRLDRLALERVTTPTSTCENKTALFVGKTRPLPADDQRLADRLATLGFSVVVRNQTEARGADASGKDLVVISDSVLSSSITTKFRDVAVPVITWEAWLFDDMKMTAASGGNYGSTLNQTALSVVDSRHPLAAGLSGKVSTNRSGVPFFWGVPGSSAANVATLTGSNQSVIFGYDAGAPMVGGTAPARRVGFYGGAASSFTPEGWALFEAASRWAAACTAN